MKAQSEHSFAGEFNRDGEQIDFDKVNLADSRYFSLLYDKYATMIWRHILLRTRSREDADEILSKTFLKTWEYVRSRRRVRNIRAFLWTVAGRLIIDFYRFNSRARERVVDLSEAEDDLPVIAPTLDERLDSQDDVMKVVTALRNLDQGDQLILTLRFVEDLSLDEVAKTRGRSKNATAVAIHRALGRLRKSMEAKDLRREA